MTRLAAALYATGIILGALLVVVGLAGFGWFLAQQSPRAQAILASSSLGIVLLCLWWSVYRRFRDGDD